MPRRILQPALFLVAAATPLLLHAQAAPGNRVLGTVTAVGTGSVTVHPAAGPDVTIALPPSARLVEAAPGAHTLANATPITPAELAVGDRVLIRLDSAGQPEHPVAAMLVAMKQSAISQQHAQQTADWDRNGVSGIVAAVDPVSGTITLKPHGSMATTIVHTTGATTFRQYAPDSTAFANTTPSKLTAIHPGDQLRARGARDVSGGSIDAVEVVTGSFRDIAGLVLSIDPSANTITLKDLKTKKPLTLALNAGTQLRRLPAPLAERLAHASDHAGSHPEGMGQGNSPAMAPSLAKAPKAGEDSDLLAQAPTIPVSDLKKGDAVMIVASGEGAPKPSAITIVAGVEPLLQAPAEASEGLFSASWNLGGGGAEEASPQH